MNKTAIKNFAVWARNKLIADISYRAGLIGITESGIASALPQSTGTTEFYDIGTAEPYSISGDAVRQRRRLVELIERKEKETDYKTAYKYIIEEVAYTWFNRLIAIRFMEVNDYLPSHIRVLSSERGKMEPDLVTTPFDADLEFSQDEENTIIRLKQENQLDELFKLLFIKQCNALNEILPALFEKTKDYTEILLNLSVVDQEGVVNHLVHDIPEEDFDVERGGQVEIIGWLYQYYNTEPKDETFDLVKKNIKITKERIPAATQLFTPDWIVKYMVENSLGRFWIEAHEDKELKNNWKFYLEEATQEYQTREILDGLFEEKRNISPLDIKVIDPCMGSGHILVYCFDVLMQIYESVGYSQRDAATYIIENNLYGLDIDDRAFQMAYFSVLMKARGYNRRILNKKVNCNLYSICESNLLNRKHLDFLGFGLDERKIKDCKNQINELIDLFKNAKELGSLIQSRYYDWDCLKEFILSASESTQITFESYGLEETQRKLLGIIEIAKVLASKYHVAVTNPPYMGSKNINTNLLEYIQSNFVDGKADIYGAFILRILQGFLLENGIVGLLTPYVWLYLSSFSNLREYIIENTEILSLVQLEYNAFEVACVPVCTYVMRKQNADYRGRYIQLAQFRGWDNQEPRTLAAINDFTLDYCYETIQSKFKLIPDSPIAYWLSESMYDAFRYGEKLNLFGEPRQGMATADNNRFMRLWFEVNKEDIDFSCTDNESTYKQWYPHSKGGSLRRWYGNNSFVINWKNNGAEIRAFKKSVVRNPDYYFKPGITWSDLTVSWFTARMVPEGFTFDSCGPTYFAYDESKLKYICGYFNSWVFQEFLNISCQGMHYSNGIIATLPIIWGTEEQISQISELVDENIEISREDWNARESSWEFEQPYYVKNKKETLRSSIASYMEQYYENVKKMENNEKEMNHIFSEIFHMETVCPTKGICPPTLNEVTEKQSVIDLIAYAVGCMFGRFSLDEKGLIYAGGDWKIDAYKTFIPDKDAIIPISDEEYLEDDIVSRFCKWIKVVYGEELLECNLDYIAEVLGNKGNSSREIIRNYFISDFYKNHCNAYSVVGSGKRPIYWLFDSGKQNGFKALIYLHRYTEDTIGTIRVDYLHRMQRVYESEINRMQDMIDHSTNTREVASATKRQEKLKKQLKECREYDEKIGHLALSRISLNLNDGVKHNYEKIQIASDGKKYTILAKLP